MPKRGTIKMIAYDTPDPKWLLCDGKAYSKDVYYSLYAKIGGKYGEDDDNFNVPDLRCRVPRGPGPLDGNGTSYNVGDKGGEEKVSLTVAELPPHNHPNEVTNRDAEDNVPGDNFLAKTTDGDQFRDEIGLEADKGILKGSTNTGGGEAHNNVSPFTCVNFEIYAGV